MTLLYPRRVTRLPTKLVNGALTMTTASPAQIIGGGGEPPLAWRGMGRRNALSGGIFLTVGILAGFAGGAATGEPMRGILIGTAIGAAAAVLLWLLDRRR